MCILSMGIITVFLKKKPDQMTKSDPAYRRIPNFYYYYLLLFLLDDDINNLGNGQGSDIKKLMVFPLAKIDQ